MSANARRTSVVSARRASSASGVAPAGCGVCADGSQFRAEFERLYDEISREVWALAYARRTDAELARDVMQEAFLRLWKAWSAGEVILNPRAWLFRVARNLAEDYAKSAFRKNGTVPPDYMRELPGSAHEPVSQLIKNEDALVVRAELRKLPLADREILTFRYALGYEVPMIAARLDTTIAAVHMRLSRARQRMAERLIQHGVDELS